MTHFLEMTRFSSAVFRFAACSVESNLRIATEMQRAGLRANPFLVSWCPVTAPKPAIQPKKRTPAAPAKAKSKAQSAPVSLVKAAPIKPAQRPAAKIAANPTTKVAAEKQPATPAKFPTKATAAEKPLIQAKAVKVQSAQMPVRGTQSVSTSPFKPAESPEPETKKVASTVAAKAKSRPVAAKTVAQVKRRAASNPPAVPARKTKD